MTTAYAEHIRNRRKALRFTLREVAAHALTSEMTVSKVERGVMPPSPDLVRRLAWALREPGSIRLLLDLCADAEIARVRARWA